MNTMHIVRSPSFFPAASVFRLIFTVAAVIPPCALVSACRNPFAETETVSFILPEWPPRNSRSALYPPLVGWDISYHTGSSSGSFRAEAGSTAVPLTVPRNMPCTVTAQPVIRCGTREATLFSPAGGIYPLAPSLTWEGGFMAQTAYRLFTGAAEDKKAAAWYLACFNWEKFRDALFEQSAEDASFNPWLLNSTAIDNAIAQHDFSVTLLRPGKPVVIPLTTIQDAAPDAAAVFCSYIPQQDAADAAGTVAVCKNKVSTFLLPPGTIAAVTAESAESYTLVIIPVAE